jgi:hypothetical protein
MPKRSAKSGKGSRTVVELPVAAPDGAEGVDEQGAFAFAHCKVCGWRSPGRRSRERARKDLTHPLAEDGVHATAVAETTP